MWETWVQSLGQEDPLEKEMATHSSILALKIPWTEEPGRLQSIGSQRVGHDWATSFSFFLSFRFRWNLEGGAPMMGPVPLEEEERLELSLSAMWEGSHQLARKRILTQNQIFQHLDLGLPVSRTVGNKRLLFRPPSQWYFVMVAWNAKIPWYRQNWDKLTSSLF